ncbi:MAG: glycoside hydrolase family 30 protein [Sphingomonas sp.]
MIRTLITTLALGTVGTAAVAAPGEPLVHAWITTADGAERLAEEQIDPAGTDQDAVTITVDPSRHYQTMVGFGAAITDASAGNIMALPPAKRDALMQDLFGTGANDLGIGFARLTIGASDFSSTDYSYDDVPKGQSDAGLAHFSLAPAREAVIPVARQALAIQPKLTVMASPWSPPGWMKTSDSMIGGTLRPVAYAPYARYFLRYVQGMARAGVPIDYLTIQNEPGFSPPDYPGMLWPAKDRATFVANDLGPLLHREAPQTKILEWDHNWDHPEQPLEMLSNATAARYVAGVAWHCYGGDPAAQSKVHAAHPDKQVFFTECSGGDWRPGWANGLSDVVRQLLIGSTRQGARGVLLWNLALDTEKGPHLGGCGTCRGVVTIDPQAGTIERTVDYYALAHLSRFVRVGAARIGSTSVDGTIETVAFANPDGSRVLLAFNPGTTERAIHVEAPGARFDDRVPAGAAITFSWRP